MAGVIVLVSSGFAAESDWRELELADLLKYQPAAEDRQEDTENTKTRKHKNTKTQKHENTKTQKHKNTKTLKTQKHKNKKARKRKRK